MTETSRFWAGTATGDCGPYSDDQDSDMYKVLLGLGIDRTRHGVTRGALNDLVASGVTSPVAVASGQAIVDGKFYENSASLNVTIPTPSTNPRIDRIVLRKSWSAQTVRVFRIAGTEAASPSAPAIVQSDGTTWDIKIAQVLITVGGVVTVTDEREFWNERIGVLLLPFGDGNATILAGQKVWARMPQVDGRFMGWEVFADASGSIVVDIKKAAYSGLPTLSTIAGSEKPTLSAAQKAQDLALTTWTSNGDFTAGDWIEGVVDSSATVKRVLVALLYRTRQTVQ